MEEKKNERVVELDEEQLDSTSGGFGKIGGKSLSPAFISCRRCNKMYSYNAVKAAGSIVCSCGSIIH